MKRQAFFLVRGYGETHLLESSVILVTSYPSITFCISVCTFPNFRDNEKDFITVEFFWEFHKFLNKPYTKSKFHCGQMFITVHALECKKGGFAHSRHDEIRDHEVALLSKVYLDVIIEPSLQPLTGETFPLLFIIIDDCV